MMLTSLILAHILGDFIFQPSKWVANKEVQKSKSPYLYLHGGVHVLLILILLWDIKYWWIALLIGVSHILIDALKLHWQTKKNKKYWFFWDQGLHILVILVVVISWGKIDLKEILNPKWLPMITVLVFLSTPTSIIMKLLLSSWTPISTNTQSLQSESLQNAGKYIGILERILVFLFITTQHWEGVGFMIAAKSVFRYSDLAEAKQRKLTEYVLIGTLLSFGIAILGGILVS